MCEHSNVDIVSTILKTEGVIRAYDAVYTLTCPHDGETHRDTRLASTIHALRHSYGMAIETKIVPGGLSEYVLAPPPKPWSIEAVPKPTRWACVDCGHVTETVDVLLLGGYAEGKCPVWECPSRSRHKVKGVRPPAKFRPVKDAPKVMKSASVVK